MPNRTGDKRLACNLSSWVYLHLRRQWEPTHRLSAQQAEAEWHGRGKTPAGNAPAEKISHMLIQFTAINDVTGNLWWRKDVASMEWYPIDDTDGFSIFVDVLFKKGNTRVFVLPNKQMTTC